jgi:hypothetical protein
VNCLKETVLQNSLFAGPLFLSDFLNFTSEEMMNQP